MEMIDLRRALLQPQAQTIGGLPVLVNSMKYGGSGGKYNAGSSNSEWFVTGFFDSGSTGSKSYQLGNPHTAAGTLRLYNDKSASSYDWWGYSVGGRSITSAGRYITFDAYKQLASLYYVYDATNGLYLARGKDIEPGNSYGGLPVLVDNGFYSNSNARFNVVVPDQDYFVAGLFDTGSSETKTYTWSYTLRKSSWTYLRLYGSKFANSSDYWGNATAADNLPLTRTETFAARYVAVTIHKDTAADMFMYNETDGVYVFKGSNVH